MPTQASVKKYIFGAALILSVITAFLTLQITESPIGAVEQQLAAAQTGLDEDQVVIRQIPALKVKERQFRDQVGHVAIGKSTIPDLLQYLSHVSSLHDVTLTNLTFSAPAASRVGAPPGVQQAPALSSTATPSTSDTVVNAAQAPPATTFVQQPVSFTLSGNYRNLLYALADLSTGPALVKVDTEPNLQQGDAHTVKMDVKATLYEVSEAFSTIASSRPAQAHTAAAGRFARNKIARKGVPSTHFQPIGQRQAVKAEGGIHG